MSIRELKAKIEEVCIERDRAIEIERDFDEFESLSNELDELRSRLYKAELREYISSLNYFMVSGHPQTGEREVMKRTEKESALNMYKECKAKYLKNQTAENWRAFCDAKVVCMRLGIII